MGRKAIAAKDPSYEDAKYGFLGLNDSGRYRIIPCLFLGFGHGSYSQCRYSWWLLVISLCMVSCSYWLMNWMARLVDPLAQSDVKDHVWGPEPWYFSSRTNGLHNELCAKIMSTSLLTCSTLRSRSLLCRMYHICFGLDHSCTPFVHPDHGAKRYLCSSWMKCKLHHF